MNEIELFRTPAPSVKKKKNKGGGRNGNAYVVPAEVPLRTLSAEPVSAVQASPLPEHFDMLRRHWRAILVLTGVGTLLGFLYTFKESPVYQARSTLEIQGLNENLLGLKSFDPNAGVEYSTEAYIQTQIKILKSDSILERVAARLQLENKPEFQDTVKRSWLAGPAASKPASPRDRMLASLRDRFKVEASGLTRILELTYDSTDPREAADFLNVLSSEYIQQSTDARGKGTEATTRWLRKQLEDLRAKLEKSDDQLQAYARSSGLIFTGEKDNLAEEKLRQLQTELSRAEAERVSRQAQYELANSSPPETLPEVLNDGSLRDYQQKLTELNRQLAELSAALTPEHYKVKRVQAEIAELKNSLLQQRGNIVRRIKNEYQAADRRESLLKSGYSSQFQLLSNQAGKTTRYNILKREVDANRQMYDAMLQKMKEGTVASAMRTATARVVDPAVPPSAPYKPSARLNAGAGLFGGLLLSLGFVLARQRSSRNLQFPGDVTHALSVRELGLIPSGRGRNLALATWEKKPSALAESFRSTVASIMGPDKGQAKVVVFTSANRAEGKSTVITNVAIAWTETRQRVLLIDADMRRPALHKFFNVGNSAGLSDLLTNGEAVEESTLSGLIQNTHIPNLALLPSGPGTPDILNMEYSSRLREMLTLCRQNYDCILIDTPPALQMPDARILARLADHVILVIRSGRTARGAAILAAQRFAEDGTPIMGSILNSLDFDGTRDIYRAYGNR